MEFNRLIAARETKRKWDIHQQHLKSIKPLTDTGRNTTIDIRRPNTFKQSTTRLLDIEFENRSLLSKLTRQKCKTDSNLRSKQFFEVKRNQKKINSQAYQHIHQNKDLLKRIQSTKPTYQSQAYQEEYKQNQKIASMISRFSYQRKHPAKRATKTQITNDASKYFDKNKASERDNSGSSNSISGSHVRQKQLSRLKQIMPLFRREIEGSTYEIVGVACQNELVLEIKLGKENYYRLSLTNEQFNANFSADYTMLCQKIQYNSHKEEFYIA